VCFPFSILDVIGRLSALHSTSANIAAIDKKDTTLLVNETWGGFWAKKIEAFKITAYVCALWVLPAVMGGPDQS
jgi:hypothetical protein